MANALSFLLSVCIVCVIQLASSQFSYNGTQRNTDVGGAELEIQLLKQLVSHVSKLEKVNRRLVAAVSKLQNEVAKIQRDSARITGYTKFDHFVIIGILIIILILVMMVMKYLHSAL